MFTEIQYKQMRVKNRLVRSAALELGTTPDGGLTEEYLAIHHTLAKGGVGTIITGITGISKEGRVMPKMAHTTHPSYQEMLHKDVKNVESEGAKLIVQLCSCGMLSHPLCGKVLAPSALGNAEAMSIREIDNLVEQYVAAAKVCERAGAHGIQIQAAHGFLLNQFLSPHFNQREDEYGGSLENRCRLLRRVVMAVKEAVSPIFAVFVKMNQSDELEDGMTFEEAVEVAKMLEESHVDGIEISCGLVGSKEGLPNRVITRKEEEGYNFEAACRIADNINVPIIAVGGFRTFSDIEICLQKSKVKGISLCRPLICEPDLPEKWLTDSTYQPCCKSCNQCFMTNPLHCKFKNIDGK
ncbi:NADH:flavin oxidoreductase [Petroclostridium sp. X23]|uniref:NADH:flavin oxidoreductase n=1 Tax=Petroclostridium sp. X23 TaxID=3045146 RepID=UPI0024ADC354|nr:NADH:flavin oxidoreductase [Petroclostridium sp. X23]WHH60643.1 NADH:flavin oxidoreductase [Petroclostridium sp. X23]